MTAGQDILNCPFCGFKAPEYEMLMHLEENHSEGSSPFLVKDSPEKEAAKRKRAAAAAEEEEPAYAECPVDGCGEVVLAAEMGYHVELHAQEDGRIGGSGEEGASDDNTAFGDDGSHTLNGDQETTVGGMLESPSAMSMSMTPPPQPRRYEEDRRSRRTRSRNNSGSSGSAAGRHGHHRDGSGRGQAAGVVQAWRNILSWRSSAEDKSKAKSAAGAGAGDDASAAAKKRLGKAELGKYAHEKRMPDWLVSHLQNGWGVRMAGIIPVLEQLLEQSPATKYAYLCNPCVEHVSKLRREGGFCGYRNIQMMSSYIVGADFPGAEHFRGHLPTIFEIQDFIEEAWDKGINAQGRVETGGVRGTRKYIGTPEAQAIFCSLSIPCDAQGFKDKEPGKSEARLLREVERYFQQGQFDPERRVRCTTLPPIYFQHPGHSLTIVGFEKLKSGQTNLLVFDPMFHDSTAVTKYVGRNFEHRYPELLLKAYRRGNKYLKKYREFEILKLRPRTEDLMG